MDDAFFVRVFERVDELVDEGKRFVWRGRSGEGLSFDELHDDGALFDSVDRGDVGVIEGREDLGFSRESDEAVGVGGEGVGEDFDGDLAI